MSVFPVSRETYPQNARNGNEDEIQEPPGYFLVHQKGTRILHFLIRTDILLTPMQRAKPQTQTQTQALGDPGLGIEMKHAHWAKVFLSLSIKIPAY